MKIIYQVSVNYTKFVFDNGEDALAFANTAFSAATKDADVEIELVRNDAAENEE